MSRMFDRLMLSDDIRPERKAQIEKAACIITADECAKYFAETKGENAEQCFINMAPPFNEPFWIEYRVPVGAAVRPHASGALVVPTDHGTGSEHRWTLRFYHFDETAKGRFEARGVLDFRIGADGSVLKGGAAIDWQRVPDGHKWDVGGIKITIGPGMADSDAKIFELTSAFLTGLAVDATGSAKEDYDHAVRRRGRVTMDAEAREAFRQARVTALTEMTEAQLNVYLDELRDSLDAVNLRAQILEAVVAVHPMAFAISLMHCKNVELRPVEPIPALSKAQFKRRGRPLVRYHELHIEPMKAVLKREGAEGGAGLAKAMHIARGHFKDFRNGKGLFGRYKGTYWWPQHLRGNAEEGEVKKGYRVSPPDT